MKKIVILMASDNENLKLAKSFENKLQNHKAEVSLIDLVSLDLPMYTQKREDKGIPEMVFQNMILLDSADAILFVTPEYNGGVPPILSNLIAWISRSGDKNWRKCFNLKKAALATHSGNGGLRVLNSLRMQLSYLGMNVIGRELVSTYEKSADERAMDNIVHQLLN